MTRAVADSALFLIVHSLLLSGHASSPTVARMTSSGVVRPAITLRMPSSRSVRMPISRARGAQHVRRHTVVNQFARLVVNHENFKDAKAPAVAGLVAIVAAPAF